MTYRQGELIVASDFNTFRTDVLDIWDVGSGNRGYGQIDTGGASPIPTVAIGEKIKSVEWEAFRFAAQTCSDHQGSTTTFPPASELLVGEIVEAHELDDGNAYDINGSLTTITSNRLVADAGSTSLFLGSLFSNRINSQPWSVEIQHRFNVDFPTVDDARYFFNSGGQLRIRGSHLGGSGTPQNDSWKSILIEMGALIFNHTSTTQSPASGTGWTLSSIGYFDLTTSFQQIAIGVSSGAYSANQATIEARTTDGPTGPNGDTGRNLQFRVKYTDAYTSGFFDTVDGAISSSVDYQIATAPLTIQTPVFTSTVLLTAGS